VRLLVCANLFPTFSFATSFPTCLAPGFFTAFPTFFPFWLEAGPFFVESGFLLLDRPFFSFFSCMSCSRIPPFGFSCPPASGRSPRAASWTLFLFPWFSLKFSVFLSSFSDLSDPPPLTFYSLSTPPCGFYVSFC